MEACPGLIASVFESPPISPDRPPMLPCQPEKRLSFQAKPFVQEPTRPYWFKKPMIGTPLLQQREKPPSQGLFLKSGDGPRQNQEAKVCTKPRKRPPGKGGLSDTSGLSDTALLARADGLSWGKPTKTRIPTGNDVHKDIRARNLLLSDGLPGTAGSYSEGKYQNGGFQAQPELRVQALNGHCILSRGEDSRFNPPRQCHAAFAVSCGGYHPRLLALR